MSKNVSILSENELNEIIQEILDMAKSIGLSITIRLTDTNKIPDHKDKTQHITHIYLEGDHIESESAKVEQFANYIKSLGYNSKSTVENQGWIKNGVRIAKGFGSAFPVLHEIKKVENDELVSFSHIKEEVMVVSVWATWCLACYHITEYEKLLEQNEDAWKGNVRIVAMSIDGNTETVRKYSEKNSLNKIEHYVLPTGWESQFFKDFAIRSIPLVFIVDKEGIIRFRGYPDLINMENAVNDLINGKSITQDIQEDRPSLPPRKNTITITEQQELAAKFTQFFVENNHLIEGINSHRFMIFSKREISSTFTYDAEVSLYFEITGDICNKDNLTIFSHKIDEFMKTFSPCLGLNKSIRHRLPVMSIEAGNQCGKCEKEISVTDPKFVCVECYQKQSPCTLCKECGDENDPEMCAAHEHPLLYIPQNGNGYLTENLLLNLKSEYVRKDNLKDEVQENRHSLPYACDNCKRETEIYDWSCAVCNENVQGSYDLCNECMKISQDINHDKYGSFLWNEEHKPEHPILRIPFTYSAIPPKIVTIDKIFKKPGIKI